jgi:Glyoxalase-like domain
MPRGIQVTIDCADPATLAEFWAAALGYVLDPPPDGFASWPEALKAWNVPESQWGAASAVVDPTGVGPRIFFQRVPEAKTVKNRVHLDVRASAGPGTPMDIRRADVAAVTDRLVGLGATRHASIEELGSYWTVLQDPEGNEFCVT